MAIYTKRGDQGKTGLNKTSRLVAKDNNKISAIGAVDELNSALGFAASLLQDRQRTKAILVSIEQDLFEIAAELATPRQKDSPFVCGLRKTRRLERLIDELERKLPVLANFVFLGGSPAAAALHLARSVCRRTEREVVRLGHTSKVNPEILRFLNRLSDALFMLARHVNKLEGSPEVEWKGAVEGKTKNVKR